MLESVRPSNQFGCSGSSRFFLCWRGDSRLSISTAEEHSCIVFSSVLVVIISGGHASLRCPMVPRRLIVLFERVALLWEKPVYLERLQLILGGFSDVE